MANNPTWGQVLGQGIGTIAAGALTGQAVRKERERKEKKELSKEMRQAIIKGFDMYDLTLKQRTEGIQWISKAEQPEIGQNSKGEIILRDAATGEAKMLGKVSRKQDESLAFKQSEAERKAIERKEDITTKATETQRKGQVEADKLEANALKIMSNLLEKSIMAKDKFGEDSPAYLQMQRAYQEAQKAYYNIRNRGQQGGAAQPSTPTPQAPIQPTTTPQPSIQPQVPQMGAPQAATPPAMQSDTIERLRERIKQMQANGVPDNVIAAELKKEKILPSLFGLQEK